MYQNLLERGVSGPLGISRDEGKTAKEETKGRMELQAGVV